MGRGRVVLSVRDWGPVGRAEIEVKPLTVFIGPNNTGKSYVAMLYYSLVRALDAALFEATFSLFLTTREEERYSGLRERLLSKIRELVGGADNERLWRRILLRMTRDSDERKVVKLLSEAVESIVDSMVDLSTSIIRGVIEKTLVREVERVYSTSIARLVRRGAGDAEASLQYEDDILSVKVSFNVERSGDTSVDLRLRVLRPDLLARGLVGILISGSRRFPLWRLAAESSDPEFFITYLRSYLSQRGLLFRRIHYFPASRAGILQGYRALASMLISMAPLAAIKGAELPGLPGPVADFLAGLVEISPAEASGAEEVGEAAQLLEDLLEGRVRITRGEPGRPPTLIYEHEGLQMQLTNASSMVGELAPLLLYMRYGLLRPGDAVIVEEPEAHLHPDKQARLAQLLAILVNRARLTVLATTHSDILLAKLGNLISASALPEEEARRMGYTLDALLKPGQVAVYNFKRGEGEVTVEPVEVSEEGIPDDAFREVVEQLYQETLEIHYQLQKLRASHAQA